MNETMRVVSLWKARTMRSIISLECSAKSSGTPAWYGDLDEPVNRSAGRLSAVSLAASLAAAAEWMMRQLVAHGSNPGTHRASAGRSRWMLSWTSFTSSSTGVEHTAAAVTDSLVLPGELAGIDPAVPAALSSAWSCGLRTCDRILPAV